MAQNKEVGHRLQEIRKRAINPDTGGYYTQTELAKRFGYTQSTIKNYENNLHEVPHAALLKYAEFGGVTIDWILTGKESEAARLDHHLTELRHFWTGELPSLVSTLADRLETQVQLLRRLEVVLKRKS